MPVAGIFVPDPVAADEYPHALKVSRLVEQLKPLTKYKLRGPVGQVVEVAKAEEANAKDATAMIQNLFMLTSSEDKSTVPPEMTQTPKQSNTVRVTESLTELALNPFAQQA
jgi:hypothetical protein